MYTSRYRANHQVKIQADRQDTFIYKDNYFSWRKSKSTYELWLMFQQSNRVGMFSVILAFLFIWRYRMTDTSLCYSSPYGSLHLLWWVVQWRTPLGSEENKISLLPSEDACSSLLLSNMALHVPAGHRDSTETDKDRKGTQTERKLAINSVGRMLD